MKKKFLSKIIVLTFTIALITGMIGGALTNEYLIAYLFGQLTGKQEKEFPIVKKIIEEKVYVEESSTLDAIDAVSDALVLISDTQTPSNQNKPINSDNFYIGTVPSSASNVNKTLATTGFMLTSDGIIATCSSFVKNRNSWFVILRDGEIYNTQVVYRDPYDDIAFLQISDKGEFHYFNTLEFNDQALKAGQKVLSLGSFNKVKSGIVSDLGDIPDKRTAIRKFPDEFLQVDYEINSSLSCGPLINLGGKFVGMTLDFDTVEQGTSYVIPASAFNDALANFKANFKKADQ